MKSKMFKRVTAIALAMCMLLGAIPTTVLAGKSITDERIASALKSLADSKTYPNGVFAFLEPRLEVQEGTGSIEFAIIRAGNTDSEATVKFKAVDISADYGDDYKIAVPGWFGDDELKTDDGSGFYKEQLKEAQNVPVVFDGEETVFNNDENSDDETSAVAEQDTPNKANPDTDDETSAEESVLSPTDEVGTDLGSAKELLTDEKADKTPWTDKTLSGEESELTNEELSEYYNQAYSEMPGAECELTFAPGETYKKLKFIVNDDDKAEDDEIAMLLLTDAKGADLVDNPSGLVVIKDNDEYDKSEFVIDEDSIILNPNEDKVTVTIHRTKGISHQGEAVISTISGTAESGIYYNPFSESLSFSADQEYRKVEIPILQRPENGTVSFKVRVEDSDSTSSDTADIIINSEVPVLFALTNANTKTTNTATINEINYWKYKKLAELENSTGTTMTSPRTKGYHRDDIISMSGLLTYNISNLCKGTYYETRFIICWSSGYNTDFYTTLRFDRMDYILKHKGWLSPVSNDYYMTDDDRKASYINYGTYYNDDTKDTKAHFSDMALYALPIKVRLVSGLSYDGKESDFMEKSDEDSWLYTKTYISPTKYEKTKQKDAKYIGGLNFADGSGVTYTKKGEKDTISENIFYKDDIISVKSDLKNSQLTKEEQENVYLWGVKIKPKNTQYGYFYVEGTDISVNDLYKGTLTGYYVNPTNGNISYGRIPLNVFKNSSQIQGHEAPFFEIRPVYRQKTAIVKFNVDSEDNIKIQNNTFKNGDIITMGKLDTVKYNVVPTDTKVILGYEWSAINYKNVSATSEQLEKELYSKLYISSGNINTVNTDVQKTLYENYENTIKKTPRVWGFEHNIQGNLSVTPSKLYVKNKSGGTGGNNSVGIININVTSRNSVISMTVNPAAESPQYQNKVIVTTADPNNAGNILTAKYKKTYKKVINGKVKTLCEGDVIKIDGYSLNTRYDFISVFKNEIDGKKYKIVWNDRTGDTNQDGYYSQAEVDALGEYYKNIDTKPMYGNFLNFVSNIPIDRQLYYYVEAKPSSRNEGVISGTVYYDGKTVLENTKGEKSKRNPASGVEVVVNGMTTVTDENGRFEFTSTDFGNNEFYNVLFNNGSANWTANIQVGCPAEIVYEEYNTFNVTDLKASKIRIEKKVINDYQYISNPIENPDINVNNNDQRYYFTFKVNSLSSLYSVGKVEAYLYSKDGKLKKTFNTELVKDSQDTYAISPTLNDDEKGKPEKGYYSFNPAKEGVSAGDYLTIRVFDQNDVGYVEHKSGIIFRQYLGAIAVINSFKAPYNGVIEYLGKADTFFDLGIFTRVDDETLSPTTEDKETGELVKTISCGWNNKGWKDKYDSSKKKKEKPEDEAKALVKDEPAAPPAAEDSGDEPAAPPAAENSGDEPAAPPADVTDKDKENEAKELVDKESNQNKKSGKLTANYKIDLKFAFSITMRSSDKGEHWYFEDMVLTATLSGDASAKYSYPTPIGVSVFVKGKINGDITGIIGVERYENNKLYFSNDPDSKEDPKIDLTAYTGMTDPNRKLTFYGGLRVRPSITIGVGAEVPLSIASLEIDGTAAFDMNFDTRGTSKGDVTLSGKVMLELIGGLIKKEYDLGKYKYNMFDNSQVMSLKADGATYSRANNLLRQNNNDSRYDVVTADDYTNKVSDNANDIKILNWNGKVNSNGETVLETPVYPDAEPYIENISGNRQFMLWIDDSLAGVDEEGYNNTSVAYSICKDGVWSAPKMIDETSTFDITPYLYKIDDDRLLILWSDISLAEDNPVETANSSCIKACFFDATTNTFSKITQVTKSTAADMVADYSPKVAYSVMNDKEYLMVSYCKDEYKQSVNDEEVTVGDLINPYQTIAYRFYDFDKEEWVDTYSGDTAEKLSVLTKAQKAEFEKNWYGQHFVDFSKYVYVDESNISDGNGGWTEKPNSEDVKLTGIGKDYVIRSFDTIGYDDKAIFAFCIDVDGNAETTEDQDIFLKVYDRTLNKEYPAIRVTNDNTQQSNVSLVSDGLGGINLFYLDNGNIAEYDIAQLIDNGLTMKAQDGTEVLIFDKSFANYNQPKIIHQADENNPVTSYSATLTDDVNIYITWTEYGVSYKDGIDRNSDEATKPENQYIEHQIHLITNNINVNAVPLYDENNQPLIYPEKDNDGNTIDYKTVKDINGLTGIVSAGDQMIKYVKTENWTDDIQLTDKQDANHSSIDATVTNDNILRFVYLNTPSTILTDEQNGNEYRGLDEDNPTLCVRDFDLSQPKYSVEFDSLDNIISGQTNTNVAVNVTNENASFGRDVEIQLYCDNEKLGSNTISSINGGITETVYINCDIPENIDGKKLKAVVVVDGKEISSTEETLVYADNWALESVDTEFVDRNTVKLTATVYNNGEEKSNGLVLHTELNGKETTDSEPFDLEIGETKTVEWTVPVKDSDFEVSTLDDGTVQEKATITVKSSANDIDTAVIRSATKEQADSAANIKDIELSDFASGEKLGTNIKLGTDELLELDINGIFNSDTENVIDTRYVSSDESVVKLINNFVRPVSKGKATITVMYAPKSNSIVCIDDTNYVTIDNWNEIPSSLIKTKTITVEVTDNVTPDEPSVEPSEPSTEPSVEPSTEPTSNTESSQSSSGNTNTGDATPLLPLFITVLAAAGLAALCFMGKRKAYKK